MPAYRFGKPPPKVDYRTLRFRTYASRLAAPPPCLNVLSSVYKQLDTTNRTSLFPMYDNDVLGDCTIAALAHANTVYHGLVAGSAKIMARHDVVKLYEHLTGGLDTGLNELDVLKYWRSN